MGAFDIAEKHLKPVTQPSTNATSETIPEDVEASRICQSWQHYLSVTLNATRVDSHLKQIYCHRPTPLVDRVIAECEDQSKVEVLAEKKSRTATRLRKENADDEEWPVMKLSRN